MTDYRIQPRFKSNYWRRRWMSMSKKKREELLYRANHPQWQGSTLWVDDRSWWDGAEERTAERQRIERDKWLRENS